MWAGGLGGLALIYTDMQVLLLLRADLRYAAVRSLQGLLTDAPETLSTAAPLSMHKAQHALPASVLPAVRSCVLPGSVVSSSMATEGVEQVPCQPAQTAERCAACASAL